MHKIIGKLFYLLLILFTIAVALAQFIAFPAAWMRPDEVSLTELMSMIEPFLFVANLLMALVWLLLWNKLFFLSILAVIVSVGHMGSYFSPRFAREYEITDQKLQKNQIKLLSYNVKSFKNSLSNMDSSLTQVSSFTPDIVSFSEYSGMGEEGVKMVEREFPQLKYHVSNKGLNGKLASEFGILIFSRYPLRNPETYEYGDLGIAVMADAIIDYRDTVRLFAVHLNSTGYNAISHEKSLESYMSDSLESDKTGEMKARANNLLRTISKNAQSRSYQADTIRMKIDESPYKTIVMGDFNDTPYSYTVRKIMGDSHVDPFREVVRNKYGYSFNLLHKLFRIDYILPEKKYYDVISYDTFDSATSDHNPIMVTIQNK